MSTKLKILLGGTVALVIYVFIFAVGYYRASDESKNKQPGSIAFDTIDAKSLTYTAKEASTTVERLLTADAARGSLTLFNYGATNAVRFFFQATSTGATATSGIRVGTTSSYEPNFVWRGEVWMRSESATSSVGAQTMRPR